MRLEVGFQHQWSVAVEAFPKRACLRFSNPNASLSCLKNWQIYWRGIFLFYSLCMFIYECFSICTAPHVHTGAHESQIPWVWVPCNWGSRQWSDYRTCSEQNSGPLWEQQVLLASESSLQPPKKLISHTEDPVFWQRDCLASTRLWVQFSALRRRRGMGWEWVSEWVLELRRIWMSEFLKLRKLPQMVRELLN